MDINNTTYRSIALSLAEEDIPIKADEPTSNASKSGV
jgi:hypothetical protein